VVAFEPNAETAATLRENIRLNGFESRVEVVECVVGEQVGEVDFFAAGTDGMSRAGQANPLLQDATARRVPVTTLDAFANARRQWRRAGGAVREVVELAREAGKVVDCAVDEWRTESVGNVRSACWQRDCP